MTEDRRLRAEDLPVGETLELGEYTVTRDEIIEFASQWDPLPLHVDPTAVHGSAFEDVIGSGVHTLAIYQRLAAIGAYQHWAIVAGRALREISLTSPLRPDTTIRATVVVDSAVPRSATRSLVSKTGQVLDGDRVLMTAHIDSYVLRRA